MSWRPSRRALRWALGVVALTLLAGGGVTAARWPPVRRRLTLLGGWLAQQRARIAAEPRRLVEPGPLTALHAAEPELTDDCGQCHSQTGVEDRRCLRCHEELGRRISGGIGYHGRDLTGPCASCHVEHTNAPLIALVSAGFNHARATFALKGKHADVDCATCHRRPTARGLTRMQFIGLEASSCTACHADPHRPTLGTDCARCHDERGWTGRLLTFVHGRDTRFALTGAHVAAECAACHPAPAGRPLAAGRLRGTPRDCAGCHTDPHAGQLGRGCASCHGTRGWTGRALRFDHARDTPFTLRGAHVDAACTACHAPPVSGTLAAARLAGTPTDCRGCHADPHRGQFGADECRRCHDQTGWTGRQLRFDHARPPRFRLTGAHARVACTQCHTPGRASGAVRYRGLGRDCASCHADPHKGSVRPADCATCHGTAGWRGDALRFDHQRQSRFALDAAHRRLDCAACHTPPVFGVTSRTCRGCHASAASALAGRLGPGLPRLAADPHDGRVTCADCHDGARPATRPADHARTCARCHTRRYAGLYLDRLALRGKLILELERRLGTRRAPARLQAAREAGSHHHTGAEALLRALLERPGGSR